MTDLRVGTLAVNANGELFAGTQSGVFRSQDNGESWTEVSTGLTDPNIKKFAVTAEGDLFAVPFGGDQIFHSADNGERWIEVPIDFTDVSALAVDADGYLFASAFGDGIYRSEEPMFSVQQPTALEPRDDEIPRAFALSRNYPNPFNPTTVISFELAAESTVELVIYNLLGQEVRRLAEGRYRPGTYQVAWDGHDDAGQPAASGVYVYRLAADAFTQVRTMVLLR